VCGRQVTAAKVMLVQAVFIWILLSMWGGGWSQMSHPDHDIVALSGSSQVIIWSVEVLLHCIPASQLFGPPSTTSGPEHLYRSLDKAHPLRLYMDLFASSLAYMPTSNAWAGFVISTADWTTFTQSDAIEGVRPYIPGLNVDEREGIVRVPALTVVSLLALLNQRVQSKPYVSLPALLLLSTLVVSGPTAARYFLSTHYNNSLGFLGHSVFVIAYLVIAHIHAIVLFWVFTAHFWINWRSGVERWNLFRLLHCFVSAPIRHADEDVTFRNDRTHMRPYNSIVHLSSKENVEAFVVARRLIQTFMYASVVNVINLDEAINIISLTLMLATTIALMTGGPFIDTGNRLFLAANLAGLILMSGGRMVIITLTAARNNSFTSKYAELLSDCINCEIVRHMHCQCESLIERGVNYDPGIIEHLRWARGVVIEDGTRLAERIAFVPVSYIMVFQWIATVLTLLSLNLHVIALATSAE
jgi:hypothetical protein